MHVTGWSKGLDVTSGGSGIVSHAGLVLLRALADKTGLTAGLSKALATPRLLIHDRGQVLAGLAVAIAGGAEVISDFAVLGGLREVGGPVASVPTAWRTLNEIAAGGPRAQARITRALNAARRQAWAGIEARHGVIPGVAVAGKKIEGVICIRLDATVTPACSEKEGAEPNYKGFEKAITRCWLTATTPLSRWPGCCARAAPARTPPPVTCRSWMRRSPRSRRSTGGG